MNFDIQDAYNSVIDRFPNHFDRPVIGITGNYGEKGCELAEAYSRSIELAGGVPLVIPATSNVSLLLTLLDRVDGLLLSGGADLNPLFWGEDPQKALGHVNAKRDFGELMLVKLAYDRQIPMLGICRGIQVLAAALGGSVHQDIDTAIGAENTIKHSQDMARGMASHYVEISPYSRLAKLFGERLAVNSFHHQAVNDPGPLLRVTARSTDGVVEAVESTEFKSVWGVQWHPESFAMEGDKTMMPLFHAFVEDALSFHKATELHKDVVCVDSHCDTPMFFDQGVRFDHREGHVKVDMHKLTEGRISAVVMAAYLKQEGRGDDELLAATAKADRLLDEIEEMVNTTKNVEIAYNPKDAFRLKTHDRKIVFLGIENGYAIGKDLANIERFRRRGVIYMTLCHNGDNDICDSAMKSQNEWGGLSDFGREVVREMNRVGMMVDLSHAAESTFYDAVELSSVPVICSHSSSRFCCDHPRNLTDDQLRTIARKGGVAQCTFYPSFLREDGRATVKDIVRHILHMVEVAGVDSVGIGSDFDGDGGVPGCANEAEMLNLTRRLLAEGLTPTQLRKIWGGNFIRVMSQVQYAGAVKL